ncbi:MAG: SOS response-associated peptidase [Polyangiales bacterium]
MCGRFTLTLPNFAALSQFVGAQIDERLAARYRRRWNIAPSDAHWIVVGSNAGDGIVARDLRIPQTSLSTPSPIVPTLVPATWGFGKGKFPLTRVEGASIANAQSDELRNATKGTRQTSLTRRRCVVPADGFYEWTGEKGDRTPFFFHRRDRAPMFFAGVCDAPPADPSDAATPPAFALLTTRANGTVAPIHHRMPVILAPEQVTRWLGGSEASQLLVPAPDDQLACDEVSLRVNSTSNDDSACVDPPAAKDRGRRQIKLFR